MPALTPEVNTLLFDHDGTLINSEKAHYEMWVEVLARYDVELSEVYYTDVMAGVPTSQNAIDVIEHFDLDLTPQALEAEKLVLVKALLNKGAFPLMPFAKETVEHLNNQGFTLAIVTGGSKSSVQKTIETYGFSEFISAVVAVEDVKQSKPAPECYLKAMTLLGKTSQECIAIEDTHHGMQAAVAAGVKCVAIPTEHSAGHDFSKATVIYNSLQHWLSVESPQVNGI